MQDATKQDKCAIRKRPKQYRVQDGQLYRLICSDSKNGDALSLYIKDAKTRKQIINGCHIGLAGNHEGRDRTLAKIAQKYFWPGLSKDVIFWVSYLSCHFYYCQHLVFKNYFCVYQCQKTKRKFDHPAEELHPVPVPNSSWKQIGIDLIGPLPTTTNGNKYVIVVTDYFLKWPEARASPTKEAINVAEFLNYLILRHGCPDVTISDQGTEFFNQVCPHVHYQTNVTLQCSETYGVVIILTW